MRITNVKSVEIGQSFWRRQIPAKHWRLSRDACSDDMGNSSIAIDAIETELVLINPTHCDYCNGDLPDFPPPVLCDLCRRANSDREHFSRVRDFVAWWSGNPDPHI